MALILAYRGRGLTRDITIKDAVGETITPGNNDHIRVSIGRLGDTPKLVVTSISATANGSFITKGTFQRVRLDASDLEFEQGTYTFFIDYFDKADADEWKVIDRQVFVLEESEVHGFSGGALS